MKSTFLALAIATAALNLFAPSVGHAQDYIVNGHNASNSCSRWLGRRANFGRSIRGLRETDSGGILRPSARPPRLSWAPFREILRVGGMSALVSATTNLTIAIITSYVGTAGVAALAGYGAGARLEFKILKCKTINPMPGRTS